MILGGIKGKVVSDKTKIKSGVKISGKNQEDARRTFLGKASDISERRSLIFYKEKYFKVA